MSNQDECEQPASFTVSVSLKANEIEVMEQLFFFGPTWDGNIVSKSGRDQLFDLKLASRVEGYSFLTADGIRLALRNGVSSFGTNSFGPSKRSSGRQRGQTASGILEERIRELEAECWTHHETAAKQADRIRELEDALRLAEPLLPPNAPWGVVNKVRAALSDSAEQ